jgi:chemotaxis signal transduction protein
LLAFRVDGRRYVVAMASVLAVCSGGEGGTTDFRGRELAVVEARDLGMGGTSGRASGPGGAVIVLGDAQEPRAVRVDSVDGIVAGAGARRWPALLEALVGPGYPGVVLEGGEALLMVDADALTSEEGTRGSGRPEEAREKP